MHVLNSESICLNCGGEGGEKGPCPTKGAKGPSLYTLHGEKDSQFVTVKHNDQTIGSAMQYKPGKWRAKRASGSHVTDTASTRGVAAKAIIEHHKKWG